MARICAYLLALGLAATCGGKPATPTLVPGAYGGARPALATTPATEFLYPDTRLVVVAASATMLESKLGWSNLANLAGNDLAELASPAALADIGIDTSAALGLAIADEATLVMFATLRNPDLFVEAVKSFCKRRGVELQVSEAGEGLIIIPADDRYAVIIRDHIGFVVASAGARSIRDLTAVRLASVPRSSSLAADPGFRAATRQLGFGRDLAGYVAVSRLTAPYLERAPADDKLEAVANQLRLRLASDPDNRSLLDQQRWLDQVLLARASKRELILRLSRQLSVAFAIELNPDRALVKLVAPAPADGLLGRLVTSRNQPHRILPSISSPPLLLLTAHADPAGLVELGELWAGSASYAPGQVKARLTEALGGDGASAVATLLSGEAALALIGDDDQWALDILLGVTDRPRAEELLAAARKARPDLVHGDHLDLPWPGIAPLHVSVAAAGAIATTDAAHLTPKPQPGAWPTNPNISALVTAAAAALVIADGQLLAGLLVPAGIANGPTIIDTDPAINRVNAAITEKLSQLNARGRRHREILAKIIGTLALRVIREDDTIVAVGGQFPDRSLIEVSTELARLHHLFADDRAKLIDAVRQLLAQRDALRSDQ